MTRGGIPGTCGGFEAAAGHVVSRLLQILSIGKDLLTSSLKGFRDFTTECACGAALMGHQRYAALSLSLSHSNLTASIQRTPIRLPRPRRSSARSSEPGDGSACSSHSHDAYTPSRSRCPPCPDLSSTVWLVDEKPTKCPGTSKRSSTAQGLYRQSFWSPSQKHETGELEEEGSTTFGTNTAYHSEEGGRETTSLLKRWMVAFQCDFIFHWVYYFAHISRSQTYGDHDDPETNYEFVVDDQRAANGLMNRLRLLKLYHHFDIESTSSAGAAQNFINKVNIHLVHEGYMLPSAPAPPGIMPGVSTEATDPFDRQLWRICIVRLIRNKWKLLSHPEVASSTFISKVAKLTKLNSSLVDNADENRHLIFVRAYRLTESGLPTRLVAC